MRLVAFGILAAMMGAGCALQAGDPGDPGGGSTELTTTQSGPKLHDSTSAAASSAPPNPEPSPWFPIGTGGVGMDDDIANPEPSPWHPGPPSEGLNTTGDPQNGGAGSTAGSAGGTSTPNHQGHLGTH
ncbi:MAG TPA: hypothetical protein VIJ22_01600 [Polyangiaceae bacterium]